MNKNEDYKKLDQIKTPEEWMESLLKKIQEEEQEETPFYTRQKKGWLRNFRLAAAILCICLLGTSISVAAYNTDLFQSILKRTFGKAEVEQVHLEQREKENKEQMTEQNPVAVDEKKVLSFQESIEVFGKKDVYIQEVHWSEDDEMITDQLYSLRENGLEKLNQDKIASFQGKIEDYSFSFDYLISESDEAVYTFNEKGDIGTVFQHLDGDTMYLSLWKVSEDSIVQKESIFSVNLHTKEMKKISGDDMKCNFLESPNGKHLLCNHRSDGYWTVFDFQNGTERKIQTIGGYNREKDIEFIDDDHILSLADAVTETKDGHTGEAANQIDLIDLNTGKINQSYLIPESCVIEELGMEWTYEEKGKDLEVRNIVRGSSFLIPGAAGSGHGLAKTADYALFGSYETPSAFYFINLTKGTYKKMALPKGMDSNLEIRIIEPEKKSLITNGEKVYLVDMGNL